MRPSHTPCWRAPLGRGIVAALFLCATPALAASQGARVQVRPFAPSLRAFARVTSVADADIQAGLDGRLTHLDALPGMHVQAGQRIGTLGGSQVSARLHDDRARLAAARSEVSSLEDALAVQREKLAQHLATRSSLDRAMDQLARARAGLASARDALKSDLALTRLRAPVSGVVVSVRTHAGVRVARGQRIARLQPDGALWLIADYYDPHALAMLKLGMHGRFLPDDGGPAIPVHVVQLPPRVDADGGQPVALKADHAPTARHWRVGTSGRVSLAGPPVMRILVPTRALVLDNGRWWVLVDGPEGPHRQAVVVGTRVGKLSVIEQGLHAGQRVITDHVYARFHRDISRHYQQQD